VKDQSILTNQLQDLWGYIKRELPEDLADSARSTGALVRCKNIHSPEDLLRVILTYGVTDLSMKATTAWASSLGIAELSAPGLHWRLQNSSEWLSYIISQILDNEANPTGCANLDVTLVDATCINGPASKGTEWRLHTKISPSTGHISSVHLTDKKVGETYKNFPIAKGEILVGDRAYALANGIEHVHKEGGFVIARANLHSIRLCGTDRAIIHPLEETGNIPETGVAHFNVIIPVPPLERTHSHKTWKNEDASDWIKARLLAIRTIKDEVIWVITTVPEEIAEDKVIMELMRVRWQIELEFKRLKSLLHLDDLPSKQGPTAESWILARVLSAILVEKLLRNSGVFSPWGYRL
jgi:hypothetical protein